MCQCLALTCLSLRDSYPLATRHSRESKTLDTDKWLFFSLPYFRFHISISVLRFPYFSVFHFPLWEVQVIHYQKWSRHWSVLLVRNGWLLGYYMTFMSKYTEIIKLAKWQWAIRLKLATNLYYVCQEKPRGVVGCHKINFHNINLSRDQLIFLYCFMGQEYHGTNTRKFDHVEVFLILLNYIDISSIPQISQCF